MLAERATKAVSNAAKRTGVYIARESVITTAAYVGGLAAIAVGIGFYSAPAGLIFAGLASVGSALLYVRPRKAPAPAPTEAE